MALIAVAVGIFLLIKGGDWLMQAAVSLSLRFSIPKIVIGMTVVSFATSAPELIVSIQSALGGHPDLALGNVVGSNIANLGLVLAITIMISPIDVTKRFYTTDWPMMMSASVLFYFFVISGNKIVAYEGAILFGLLILFLIYLIKFQEEVVLEDGLEEAAPMSAYKMTTLLLLGGFSLWLGSETLIKGAVSMAQSLGVSERIISVSIVSVGTSIPELSASIIAIINKEKAISIGNLVGSNVFNIMAVMGITSMISPVAVQDFGLLGNDVYWMLAISFIILPMAFLSKRTSEGKKRLRLGTIDGVVLIILYSLFLIPLLW
jgi:cation:H+ antiporter